MFTQRIQYNRQFAKSSPSSRTPDANHSRGLPRQIPTSFPAWHLGSPCSRQRTVKGPPHSSSDASFGQGMGDAEFSEPDSRLDPIDRAGAAAEEQTASTSGQEEDQVISPGHEAGQESA